MEAFDYFKENFQFMNYSFYLGTIIVVAIILRFFTLLFDNLPSYQEVNFSDEHTTLLNSTFVIVSFGCTISTSIPMFVEVLLDYLTGDDKKLKWLFIRERTLILVGLIYSPIGYFIAYSYFPSSIALIVDTLTNTQELFLMWPIFSIILKTSDGKIWTSVNLLLITTCVAVSHVIAPYKSISLPCLIISYLVKVVAFIVFFYCYIKMIIDINWRSNRITSREFLTYLYTSLLFLYLLLVNLVPLTFSSNKTIFLTYLNFMSIFFTVSVSVAASRVNRIELNSLNETLRLKQSFVRFLSHEMRTPINVTTIGTIMTTLNI